MYFSKSISTAAEDELDLIFAKVFSAEFGAESFQKLLTSDEILSFFAINE